MALQVSPVVFTGSGEVGTPAHLGVDSFGRSVPVNAQNELIVGIAYTGFTAVVVHNGGDATGDVAMSCGGPGTYSWNYEVACNRGLYLECTGTGRGTVWLV